jgi:hypothetical protein
MSPKQRRRQAWTPARPPVEDPPPEPESTARPRRPFGTALFGSRESITPSGPRSLGRGLLTIASTPLLLLIPLVAPAAIWLLLLQLGYEGPPGPVVAALALPPISSYLDVGLGQSIFGNESAFLVFAAGSIVIRGIAYGALTGMIVEALEDGRVTRYGLITGIGAIPTALVVQVIGFSLIPIGNQLSLLLGPGLGFFALVGSLVGGVFLLGFATTVAVRQRVGVVESVRRSGRAAMLPGSRQLAFSALYFFIAIPVLLSLAGVGGGSLTTANPPLVTWMAILVGGIVHLTFMAAYAYRWIVVEPVVPDEPVPRRRTQGREPSRRPSGRR